MTLWLQLEAQSQRLAIMACNLSQYCAGNIAAAKHFYRDICRGNIFTGTIAAAKLFGSVNTGTIASAKSKILWIMACNLSQYCAGNIAEAKKFYRDICRGNIFTGTIAAAKLFGSVNTGTIAPAKSKILWMGKYHSKKFTEPFAAAKTFTCPFAAAKIFTKPNLIIT